ncbi:MAG: carbonic anhydrase [Candidatus Gastranaerophilales bacterium]|nr:carbonic anhydrase [Candidatus Gastranaerophilales bacterium]
MKKLIFSLILLLFTSSVCIASGMSNLSADEALQKLKEGNIRFQEMHLSHPDLSKERRAELLKGQHPFTAVLTCSDSRVPPELIFDQGLGDIFEIRNAGNVLDKHVIGSIEYAVVHLGVKLVIIMGHEDCGAVTAAVKKAHEGKYIDSFIKSLQPAIKESKKHHGSCTITNTVKENAIIGAEELVKSDRIISHYVKEKGLLVIPAYYHLDDGEVEFLKR